MVIGNGNLAGALAFSYVYGRRRLFPGNGETVSFLIYAFKKGDKEDPTNYGVSPYLVRDPTASCQSHHW